MVAVGTSVQSYPFKTLVTASFISLLSSCAETGKDADVADVLICMVAVEAATTDAAVDVVVDEIGERDKEPEPSISKLSSQKKNKQSSFRNIIIHFTNSQFMNEHSKPPVDQI